MTDQANKLTTKLGVKEQKPKEEKSSTAGELSKSIGADLKDRLEGERSIIIKMKLGEQPSVEFGGFWSGKFIRAAQNAIAKAYRTRRHQFIGRV